MKKSFVKVSACAMATTLMFSSYAYAFGVNFNSKTAPSSVKANSKNTYALSLEYDTEVYGIPVPMPSCQIGAEFSTNAFSGVTYKGGSFSSMNFVAKTNGKTGQAAYQCYKSFTIMGKETKEFTVEAKTVNSKAKGKAYMGVGKNHFGYDYSFTVNVTK